MDLCWDLSNSVISSLILFLTRGMFNSAGCSSDDSRTMNWGTSGTKRLWPNLRRCFEELWKPTTNPSRDRQYPGQPPEYKAEMLPHQLRRWIRSNCVLISKGLSPSSGTNILSTTERSSNILWKAEIHYRVLQHQPVVLALTDGFNFLSYFNICF
jgi:hypothetical protein